MKKITTIFIILLFCIGCSKSGDNINDVNNVDDYPELILGTWYLETIKYKREVYYVDPVFGTSHTSYINESLITDGQGVWITFEYDFDGYYGLNDMLTDTFFFFNYTLVNDSMRRDEIGDGEITYTINELNDVKLDLRTTNTDSVSFQDTLWVTNIQLDEIYYREIITPIDSTTRNFENIIN
tara:strand:+ start:725 stop:1270 length:546 start_codon:yes stop_codon:yes gene_type:complete